MTGTKAERVLTYLIGVAAFFVLVPILVSYQDIWDGRHVFESFVAKDKVYLKALLLETRWTLQYYMYVGLEAIQHSFGIPYKMVFNILAGASVAGISVEIYRLMRDELSVSREASLLAMLTVLVLPPWGTLICSVLAFHASCVWAFLLSLRFRSSRPVVAGIFFIYSLLLNSVFAFAVGYVIFKAILVIDKDNWKPVFLRVFLISAGLLAAFVLYKHFFPPFGWATGYNSFNPQYSGVSNFLIAMAVVVALCHLAFARSETPEGRILLYRRIGACVVLAFFAGLAYWYVGKSVKLTGTNSFTPRQAFLVTVPVSLLAGVIAEYARKRFGSKVTYGVIGAVLLLSFGYQFAAFQQKYVQLYYENAMLEALKKVEEPLPGLVVIDTERQTIPKELRDSPSASAPVFLKAYGHRNWAIKICSAGDNCDNFMDWDYLVDRHVVKRKGFSPDELYITRLKYRVDNFDVFGNPLYYYYYFTNAINRLNPRFEVVSVEKYSL